MSFRRSRDPFFRGHGVRSITMAEGRPVLWIKTTRDAPIRRFSDTEARALAAGLSGGPLLDDIDAALAICADWRGQAVDA